MALESGMVAKIAAAVGLAGISSAGVYYGQDYFSPKSSLSKYDQVLIDFLEGTNNDIIFEVKNGNSDLSVDGPTLTNESSTLTAQVLVNTSNKAKFKMNGQEISEEEFAKLKRPNSNADWTWSCEFEFKKADGVTQTAIEVATKNKIIASDDKGLFGILKKDLSSYTHNTQETNTWTKQALIDVKKDFIKQCAKARLASNKHQKESLTDNKLNHKAATITFKNATGTGANNLVLDDSSKAQFAAWFKDIYGTNNYKTSS